MKWISVEDGLPEDEERVLIYDSLSKLCGDSFLYLSEWDVNDGVIVNVTHWMPLPAPPEDE